MTRKRVPASLRPLAIAPLGMGRPWCLHEEGGLARYSPLPGTGLPARGHSPPAPADRTQAGSQDITLGRGEAR